jgi:hypothetical protein
MNSRVVALLYAASLTTWCVAGCGGDDTATRDSGVDASHDADVDTSHDADVDASHDVDVDASLDADADTDAGSPPPSGHVLISELVVAPDESEFFELWNPTDAAVELSDYHVADNSAYTRYATGVPWAPVETGGTDFLVRFPAGSSIAPSETLVVAMSTGFEAAFGRCPDFVVSPTGSALPCGTSSVPAMLVPPNGGVGTNVTFSNARELLVLFVWNGVAGHAVQDVDYVTWGTEWDDNSRVDKTGIAGYVADTPRAEQTAAPAPGANESIGRCSADETGESGSSGNGLTGHDETGESLNTTFRILSTPSPGVVNVCP